MKTIKEKIIAGCLVIGIIMTLFPPQTIVEPRHRGEPFVSIEYRFIGDGGRFNEQTSIAFERLLLQYAMLVGAGFALYLLGKKAEE